MDSEDGEFFIKQLATFVRTHEKALANALQFQRQSRHRPSQSTGGATLPPPPTVSERPSTATSTSSSLAAALSLGNLSFTSHNVKPAKLALTPHHLFYLLSRFEDLGISVGPMKIRLENLHDSASSANYVSFLSGSNQRSRTRSTDATSIHSVSSVRSVMSGMSALWASLGIGSSISAARTERQKAALEADMKYLYSAFTKIPCLRLAPDWRARLIRGYEEFPFDSAVPLYAFKNLQALEVSSIDFRQFFGWDRMADQLRSLTLRQAGIEDPADILIDIVLDDMDKRRRRTSKSQTSPTTTWAANTPRRSPSLVHPELARSVSLPCSPDPRATLGDLRVGSLTPPDGSETPTSPKSRPIPTRKESDDYAKSPAKSPAKFSRPRSISPSRPATSRTSTRNSQRITRSGSGSSHSSLSDSWYHHHHARGSSGNLLSMNILPSSKWRFLRHLSLADNAMTSISRTSLAPLSNTLYSLDLSSNLFNQIPESLATLTALRALNLSHCMIDALHSLTRNPLPAITALNLRANRLQSLAGIEKLYPLERLDLRDNRLGDPKELARLTGIPDIREIWVDGNPFTRAYKDYRVTIFNLFRATPGYTEDIIIDGTGPSYAEKRLLIERVPIPDSVPVVKPAPVEVPAVEISKPAVIQAPREPAVLRKERPVAKAVTSEVSNSSRRRRKTPKRRIVDLATRDGSPRPAAPEPSTNKSLNASAGTITKVDASEADLSPKRQLLPAPVLSPRQSEFAPVLSSSPATIKPVESPLASNADSEWTAPSDWDASGDYYRRKIEALRNTVGEGYLSALSEESWESTPGFDMTGLSNVASLRAGHLPHHVPAVQAVHSGRTLG
ncbi:hypothetical protein PWT90_09595 [Aphanocladium album]|nr:hypothetical protein PWT90_09595 [Aphanocladium album]